MFICYKYAPDGTKIVDLYYVDNFIYWYTSEALGKLFLGTIWKILQVNFLEFSH